MYRIDPKTRRIIVSDLTPSIRIPLSSLPYYMDEILTSGKAQEELLINLAGINEKLDLLLGSTPAVKFKDKDNNIHTLDELLKLSEGVLATQSHNETEAHEGHAFVFDTASGALGDDATLNIAFKVSSGSPQVHLTAGFTTLVGGSLAIIEAPTWTQGSGTATSVVNRLRVENPPQSILLENDTEATFTATNKVLVDVADLAGGTTLWSRYQWGITARTEGGDYRTENEFLLRSDTTYAIVFTAIGASNKAQIYLNWIEH